MKSDKIFIITGRSGSGKSTAIAAFEDAGYYCVENMPVVLLPDFLDLPVNQNGNLAGFAFVMDLREKGFLSHYQPVLESLKKRGCRFEIIFLEAEENILLQRYSQTRRNHPMAVGKNLIEGIRAEKEALKQVRNAADIIIDTTHYTVHELKSELFNILRENVDIAPMRINVLSFGFKYGIPHYADVIVDVRFLPNPYFFDHLRDLDGEAEAVRQFLSAKSETQTFLKKYIDLLDYLIPLYEKEGKTYLTLAVGCTGGRHRSVYIAREIYAHVLREDRNIKVTHRDIMHES